MKKKKYIGQLTECSLVPWGDWHPLLCVINTTTLKTGPVLQVIFFSDEEMKHQWDETDRQSHSKPRVLSLTEKTWEETFSLTHNHHGISCKYKLEVLGAEKWGELSRKAGVSQSRRLSQEVLIQVSKEVLSWLKGVIDFRVFAIMNPTKSDTRVLKTWL